MCPKSDNYYKNYYNITDIINETNINIKLIECENYGYSPGQWLKAYELYLETFDYYLFIEDDYCPGMDNFDSVLIDIYKKKFDKEIGLLCSLVQGSNDYHIKGLPIHFEGCVFINKNTLKKMYNFHKWEKNPRHYLNMIDNSNDHKENTRFFWNELKKIYLGAYYQVSFSHLFTLAGIEHNDYLDIEYNDSLLQFPYWDDTNNINGGIIFFYEKGEKEKYTYSMSDIYNSPIIPIQLSKLEYIKKNTGL